MKQLLFFIGVAASVALFSGCSKVVATKVDTNVAYVVQFNSSDFNIGRVVTAELPYDASNPTLVQELLNKAIAENKCDTILLPRYQIIEKTFGSDIIRLTGRAATFKTR